MLGDGGRADEADGLDVGVLEQAVDGVVGAVDDVEHAGRAAGLEEELGQGGGYTRIYLLGSRRGDASEMAIIELV